MSDHATSYGRYRIERPLGQGGMGVVWAATDTVLGRPAAVKVVTGPLAADPEFRTRFGREAEALAQLDSPHVITIFDHGEQDGVPYIATQLVAGGDLDQLLQARGPLPIAVAAGICAQVADALHDSHRIGIVHRDVKASNVLVRDPAAAEPFVYLCDFGIAVSDDDSATRLTQPGGVAGTWAYLSPERADGHPAQPASDVYALGCLLWVCLTGGPPYTGTQAQQIMAHRDAPVPQLPGPEQPVAELNAVLARALAKKPDDRYADAASMRDDLLALARSARGAEPIMARPGARASEVTAVRTPGEAGPRSRRVPLLLLAAVVLVGAVIAGFLVIGGDADTTAPTPPTAPGPDESAARPVTGDLDGDGHGDVLMTQTRLASARDVATLTWSSNGAQLGPMQEAPPQAEGFVHLGDVDADGADDQVYVDAAILEPTIDVTVVPSSGAAAESTTFDAPTDQMPPTALVADFDGDGRADLGLVYDSEDRANFFVALSGDDGFGDLEQWYAGSESWSNSEYSAGDLTGDGRADVLIAAPHVDASVGETWQILVSDGSAADLIGKPYDLTGAGRALATPLVGDFDGDGTAEIALLGGAKQAVSVFEVEDATVTGFSTWLGGLGGAAEVGATYGSVAVTDLDGDGTDDLVWLTRGADGEGDGELLGVLSTGSEFSAPTTWGTFTCGSECEDRFSVALPY